jgi:hypothetical protein
MASSCSGSIAYGKEQENNDPVVNRSAIGMPPFPTGSLPGPGKPGRSPNGKKESQHNSPVHQLTNSPVI